MGPYIYRPPQPTRARRSRRSRRPLYLQDDRRRAEIVEPHGVQEDIDKLAKKFKDERSFARASGTEDAVRVCAEVATRSGADDLASNLVRLLVPLRLLGVLSWGDKSFRIT
jgi:phosphoacetylglucosamine mutase